MATWHETMMRSSQSFKDCHEGKGSGGCSCPNPISWYHIVDKPFGAEFDEELVNTYISMTQQSDSNGKPYFWSIYDGVELVVDKYYLVKINDELFEVECVEDSGKPSLIDWADNVGLIFRYNPANGMFLISYYPENIADMDYNITTNFELYSLKNMRKQ